MALRREVADLTELLELIAAEFDQFAHIGGTITAEVIRKAIVIEPYGPPSDRTDHRNGWDTHIIVIQGYGVWGFASGPVPGVQRDP
jgi:hypothetical protein